MFIVGLLVGGIASGLLVGLVSVANGFGNFLFLYVVAVLLFLETINRGKGLPQRRRLVPQSIVGREPNIGALQFGFELGLGFRTYIPSALPYALVVLAVSSGFGPSVLGGIGFALGRMIMVAGSFDYQKWDDSFQQVSLVALRVAGPVLLLGSFVVQVN